MMTLHNLTGCASERTFCGSHEAHIAAFYNRMRLANIDRQNRRALDDFIRRNRVPRR